MSGEGFKLSVILIVCFMVIILASLYMIAESKVDMPTLKEMYEGIGILAGIFGVGPIIAAYIVTRGQTTRKMESIELMPATLETTVPMEYVPPRTQEGSTAASN